MLRRGGRALHLCSGPTGRGEVGFDGASEELRSARIVLSAPVFDPLVEIRSARDLDVQDPRVFLRVRDSLRCHVLFSVVPCIEVSWYRGSTLAPCYDTTTPMVVTPAPWQRRDRGNPAYRRGGRRGAPMHFGPSLPDTRHPPERGRGQVPP